MGTAFPADKSAFELRPAVAPRVLSVLAAATTARRAKEASMSNKDPNKKLQLRKLTIRELTVVSGGTCGMTRWTGCEGCSQRSEISRKR